MGFSSLKAILIRQVRAATPVRSPLENFTCVEDATGPVDLLDDFSAMAPDRRFDLRLDRGPVDDGESGRSHRRLRAHLLCRVAYRLDGDRSYAEEKIAEDVSVLIDALMLTPLSTGFAAAGGDTVSVPGEVAETTVTTKEDNKVLGRVIAIPFDLLYHEGAAE